MIVPFWTSFLIRTYSFLIVLSPEFFALGLARQTLHLTNGPLHILQYTITAIQIGLVYNYLPLFVLPLYATLERMDWAAGRRRARTSARSQWTAFRQITLRLTRARADHGHAARVHPDDGRVRDPADPRRRPRRFIGGNVIQRARSSKQQDYAFGSARRDAHDGRAVGFFAAYLYLSSGAHGVRVRCVGSRASSARSPALRRLVAGHPGWLTLLGGLVRGHLIPARPDRGGDLGVVLIAIRALPAGRLLGGYSALVYALLFMPILVVVVYAFIGSQSVESAASRRSGSAPRWTTTRSPRRSGARCGSRSLGDRRRGVRHGGGARHRTSKAHIRPPFDMAVFLTLVVPELVIAVSTLIFFVRLRLRARHYDDVPRPHRVQRVARHAHRARPLRLDGRELEGVSMDLGAGPIATFRQVTLPRLAPAIIAAAALSSRSHSTTS